MIDLLEGNGTGKGEFFRLLPDNCLIYIYCNLCKQNRASYLDVLLILCTPCYHKEKKKLSKGKHPTNLIC